MNGGTNRGQADGFQLSVLNKIRDVKTQVGRERNLGFVSNTNPDFQKETKKSRSRKQTVR